MRLRSQQPANTVDGPTSSSGFELDEDNHCRYPAGGQRPVPAPKRIAGMRSAGAAAQTASLD